MVKEVGASGQILLGERFAGMRFDVIQHPDNRIELIPVCNVPPPATLAPIPQSLDGWVPPGGYDSCTQWALDNREALEHYARQVEQEGTAAEQLQRFLAMHPTGDGEV